jgi:hypothetical protein
MRLILTILLIGLFKADAQVVINASAPYRPLVSANLLLDDYPNAAGAYSLRKLRTAYTGAAIRVRKDTTGQPEQDINFVGNELDTASLKSFLNARNGFVTTWYDQSGNARNATQTVQANQPRIANLGVIDRRNTKVTLVLDGTNDELRADDVATTITGEDKAWTTLSVVTKNNTTDIENILGFGNTTLANPLIIPLRLINNANYGVFLRQTSSPTPTINAAVGTYAANTQYLMFNYSTGLFYNLFSNNNSIISESYNTGTITLNTCTIGAIRRSAVEGHFDGNIQEVVIYSTDQSTNRTGMQTNINSFYSIY